MISECLILKTEVLIPNYELEIDYGKLMGEWSNHLSPILSEPYMYELMVYLHENYKNKKDYFPAKKDIFKIFNDIPLKDISVVIVNCLSAFNGRNNGIAFGNKDNLYNNFDTRLTTLFDDIEQELDNGLKIEKDYTLSNWIEQGVFLLNVSLTGSQTKSDTLEWSRFINFVLNYLNEECDSTIFLFVGDTGNHYSSKIEDYKHIILNSQSLNVEALKEINSEIKQLNGQEYCISW